MIQLDIFSKEKIVEKWSDLKWFGSDLHKAMDMLLDGMDDLKKPYCPVRENIFKAFELTPFDKVSVVILGQDPYPSPKNAMGLAFSVPKERVLPPSLMNIFKEMEDDVGCCPEDGNLMFWAKQGVLLLNSILTCAVGNPMSHEGLGWENLTSEAIYSLIKFRTDIIFICWGNRAHAILLNSVGYTQSDVDRNGHLVLRSAHPSPMSADKGFFGSRPFSKTNEFLKSREKPTIQWCGLSEEPARATL